MLVPKKKSRCALTPSSIVFHQITRLREETERMLEEQRQKEAQRVQRIWQQAGTYQQRRTSNRSQEVIQLDKELAYFISFQLFFLETFIFNIEQLLYSLHLSTSQLG